MVVLEPYGVWSTVYIMNLEAKKMAIINLLKADYSLVVGIILNEVEYFHRITQCGKDFDFNNLRFTGTKKEVASVWEKLFTVLWGAGEPINGIGVRYGIKDGSENLIEISQLSPECSFYIASKGKFTKVLTDGDTLAWEELGGKSKKMLKSDSKG